MNERESKKQEGYELQDITDGHQKLLDELPTGVVQIPMKETIRTSVLSKDWKYLWTYNPNLDKGVQIEHFMNFVDWVLINSVACSTIKFSLSCSFEFDADSFNYFMEFCGN